MALGALLQHSLAGRKIAKANIAKDGRQFAYNSSDGIGLKNGYALLYDCSTLSLGVCLRVTSCGSTRRTVDRHGEVEVVDDGHMPWRHDRDSECATTEFPLCLLEDVKIFASLLRPGLLSRLCGRHLLRRSRLRCIRGDERGLEHGLHRFRMFGMFWQQFCKL